MKKIFITGVYRSGTTLLEKVLNAHPDLFIASQPLPFFFFHLKETFYKKIHKKYIYPIQPDFGEEKNYNQEFEKFLEDYEISLEQIRNIFKSMESYSGQQTPELFKIADKILPGTFHQIFGQVCDELGLEFNNNAQYSGSKEIICEEFTPFLLRQKSKVIIIVRDPRDIICSLNFGEAKKYTGEIRPLLYSLRLWRKSVAYCIKNYSDKNFLFIRYEDLVSNQSLALDMIWDFLAVSKNVSFHKLFDHKGNDWPGNSSFQSFEGVNASSVGRYKQLLDLSAIRYIESICFPEMKYLNYNMTISDFDENIVETFIESFINHKTIDKNYTHDAENIELEKRRNMLLRSSLDISLQRKFFLFPEVYEILKKAI